jgi:hypothetical protein
MAALARTPVLPEAVSVRELFAQSGLTIFSCELCGWTFADIAKTSGFFSNAFFVMVQNSHYEWQIGLCCSCSTTQLDHQQVLRQQKRDLRVSSAAATRGIRRLRPFDESGQILCASLSLLGDKGLD